MPTRQHRVLGAGLVGRLLAVHVAHVICTASQIVEHSAQTAAGVSCAQLEQIACQLVGAAGHAFPHTAADASVHKAPQKVAGAGQHDLGHIACDGSCIGAGRGACGGTGRRAGGCGAAGRGDIVDEVFHVVQHAVSPQITRDIVQDQAIDLTVLIGGIVAHIGIRKCYPR